MLLALADLVRPWRMSIRTTTSVENGCAHQLSSLHCAIISSKSLFRPFSRPVLESYCLPSWITRLLGAHRRFRHLTGITKSKGRESRLLRRACASQSMTELDGGPASVIGRHSPQNRKLLHGPRGSAGKIWSRLPPLLRKSMTIEI